MNYLHVALTRVSPCTLVQYCLSFQEVQCNLSMLFSHYLIKNYEFLILNYIDWKNYMRSLFILFLILVQNTDFQDKTDSSLTTFHMGVVFILLGNNNKITNIYSLLGNIDNITNIHSTRQYQQYNKYLFY